MRGPGLSILVGAVLSVSGLAQPPGDDYELVWSDEFDGDALDHSKWGYRQLGPRRDAINTEDSVSLDGDGHLLITTSRAGDAYHTGMIGTAGKFEPRFGYFECRLKMHRQIGYWSAFWLQSPTVSRVGDSRRTGTEVDIYEYLGNRPDVLHLNLHWDGYGKDHKHAGTKRKIPGVGEGFHTIGLQWTPTEYVFFCDGKEIWRTTKGISHRSEYMILSCEVAKWAGDIAKADLPEAVVFDYVRVYQRPEDTAFPAVE